MTLFTKRAKGWNSTVNDDDDDVNDDDDNDFDDEWNSYCTVRASNKFQIYAILQIYELCNSPIIYFTSLELYAVIPVN